MAYFTASCDTPETNAQFAKSLDADYPILSDPTKTVARAYGVVHANRALPERWTFYIDPKGIIRAIDRQVNIQAHGEQIARKLAELKVPTTSR